MIPIPNRWLAAVVRRMANIFLHPDFIYKLTKSYQNECNWITKSEIMPNLVKHYSFLLKFSLKFYVQNDFENENSV